MPSPAIFAKSCLKYETPRPDIYKKQYPSMEPIWKDYPIDLGLADSVAYRVRLDDAAGEIIYQGRAYLRPDADTVSVRINDIAADYYAGTLPALSQAAFEALALPLTFYVETYDEALETWSEADTVQFLNDWSYDPSFNPATMGLAHPITGRIDSRQWLVYTALNASSVTMTIHYTDGTTASVVVPIEISADFNADFNSDFARSAQSAGSGTAVFDLSAWSDVAYVTIGAARYDVVGDCYHYALYYRNAYGGFDTLLLEGNCSRRDSLTRYNAGQDYDNRNPQNRGLRNYANELAPMWTLRTGILDDNAGQMMHHLLNSPDVFLYDIDTDTMQPVTIEDTETEYLAYKTDGHQPVQYTITARIAQEFVRR